MRATKEIIISHLGDGLEGTEDNRSRLSTHEAGEHVNVDVDVALLIEVADTTPARGDSAHETTEARDLDRPPALLSLVLVRRRAKYAERVLGQCFGLVGIQAEQVADVERKRCKHVELEKTDRNMFSE